MLAIITKMTLTQVSTWFANARRRLKKENKMTWEPKNKTDDDDDALVSDSDDKDKDDDDKRDDTGRNLFADTIFWYSAALYHHVIIIYILHFSLHVLFVFLCSHKFCGRWRTRAFSPPFLMFVLSEIQTRFIHHLLVTNNITLGTWISAQVRRYSRTIMCSVHDGNGIRP